MGDSLARIVHEAERFRPLLGADLDGEQVAAGADLGTDPSAGSTLCPPSNSRLRLGFANLASSSRLGR